MADIKDPFEKMQFLLEKLVSQSGSCLGDKCPQFNQLKVKQNLFIAIAGAFVAALIGISASAHIEINNFKDQFHSTKVLSVSKEVDLSRQVKTLNYNFLELYNHTKKADLRLNKLEINIEHLKTKLQ